MVYELFIEEIWQVQAFEMCTTQNMYMHDVLAMKQKYVGKKFPCLKLL